MNFNQLKCFHTVAEYGSFTAASKVLFIGQPSITTHIKSLERRFGVELFYRHGHTVVLTKTGEDLLVNTKKIFELERKSEEMLRAVGGLLEGEIRISAFDPVQVAKIASHFHKQLPGIKIKVSFGNSDKLIESLLSLEADVAILPKLGDKRLYTLPYKRVPITIITNDQDPLGKLPGINIQQLEGINMIVREQGSMQQRIVNHYLNSENINIHPVLEIDSQDAVREAIAAGMGVGIALDSEEYFDPRLRKVQLYKKSNDPITIDLEIASLLERKDSPIIKKFFSFFQS